MQRFILLSLILGLSAHAQSSRRGRPTLCAQNTTAMVADGRLEVDVFLGYYDNSPSDFVVNFMERSAIVRKLTQFCRGDSLCGFTMDPSDRRKFSKIVDRNDKPVIVEVTIHNSAVLEFTSFNQTPAQRDLSQRTEAAFTERLKAGEAVFYLGHSRYGGGPDFRVPVLRADWTVDADFYRREKPGVRLLESGLRDGGAQLFGAFSCDSVEYFGQLVRRASPRTLFIGTTLSVPTYDQNMDAFFSALENTLAGECDYNDDFMRASLPARLVR
jgi:hypothetical protein